MRFHGLLVLSAATCLSLRAMAAGTVTDMEVVVPPVTGNDVPTVPKCIVSPMASKLPFAYYPSVRQVELAFDKEAPLLQEWLGDVHRPAVKSRSSKAGLAWATYEGTGIPDDPQHAKRMKSGSVSDLNLPSPTFNLTTNVPYVIAGRFDVAKKGTYTFVLRPQSASILQIDDMIIADQTGSKNTHGTWEWKGSAIALDAGPHRIQLRGNAQQRRLEHTGMPLVLWSGPGFWRKPMPASILHRESDADFAIIPAPIPDTHPLKALEEIAEVPFQIIDCRSSKAVTNGVLKLNEDGQGQARYVVGDLPESEYGVEYLLDSKVIRLPQTFTRTKFPWEGTDVGKTHTVFPPFTPVRVNEATLSVVDRTYTINSFGLLDSVISRDHELLAGPMMAVGTAGGKPFAWSGREVKGQVLYPDLAEFNTGVDSDALKIDARVQAEEDGCLRVTWTLIPGAKPVSIERLTINIPLKESEAPLFGWASQDSMRHHYWGEVPPLANIIWDTEPARAPGQVPAAWSKGDGPPAAEGVVWDSTHNLHWNRGNLDPFVCYVWLGSEERGLAWFADSPCQFVNDGSKPVQLVRREPGRVVLTVRIIQKPLLLDKPRKIEFGLQACPTKPLRPDWRKHEVPGGAGLPDFCWGGCYCSSKYPDNHNFAIVDEIMWQFTNSNPAIDAELKLKFKALESKRLWNDIKPQDRYEWADTLSWFRGAAVGGRPATYIEELANYTRMPEWQIYQDEWGADEFNRFQAKEGNWGVTACSYHDFALYYQREYMKRGVSIYYDNVMPRGEKNPFVLDGERDNGAGIWGLRSYFRRAWKLVQQINRDKVAPDEIDFVMHVTNCQVLPWLTWATGTLDLEQRYRGIQPYPPDYTRAMTMGRHAGAIAYGCFPLVNICDYRDAGFKDWTEEQALADWGMFTVHEVRSGHWRPWSVDFKLWRDFEKAMKTAGYEDTQATVINYWLPAQPVTVRAGKDVPWIAVITPPGGKAPKGVLGAVLLQSYADKGTKATVSWAGAKALIDYRTRKSVGTGDKTEVNLPGQYATRLLWAVDDPSVVPPMPGK
jgi:hypothetical protein